MKVEYPPGIHTPSVRNCFQNLPQGVYGFKWSSPYNRVCMSLRCLWVRRSVHVNFSLFQHLHPSSFLWVVRCFLTLHVLLDCANCNHRSRYKGAPFCRNGRAPLFLLERRLTACGHPDIATFLLKKCLRLPYWNFLDYHPSPVNQFLKMKVWYSNSWFRE